MDPLIYQSNSNHSTELKAHYNGTKIADLPTPAAILDAAIVRRNCQLMLDTASKLDISFRAHIKTHKTIQGSRLQVGDHGPVRLVVSTVAELEHITHWLKECVAQGREVSVLYGVPAAPSSVPRIARLAHVLGSRDCVAFMVDHPTTLELLASNVDSFPAGSGGIPVYFKVDTGYGRAGAAPNSSTLTNIAAKLTKPSVAEAIKVLGLYSHLGHSYGFNSPIESLQGLLAEFEALRGVAEGTFFGRPLTLSVGATPTATAAQILANDAEVAQVEGQAEVKAQWDGLKASPHKLEIHAGVYPFLDMQQLATQARISNLSYDNIGFKILAEVASLYTERAKPEALIAAGSIALGREPCKSYSGWGVVTPYSSLHAPAGEHFTPENGKGWIVGRISQEHGILTWEGDAAGKRELAIGEKLMVWPNHACIAGAGFGWYYIVDSDVDGGQTVQDIWVRCRGW